MSDLSELPGGTPVKLKGHDQVVRALAFTDVGASPLVATAGLDQSIRIWDVAMLAKPKCVHVLKVPGSVAAINTLAFGRVGGQPVLVAGGEDCTVRLWNATTGQTLGSLADHANPVTAVTTFEDDSGHLMVCTAAEDGTHLIRLSAEILRGQPDEDGPKPL
jgi:WD40 repeat protein